MTVLIGQDAFFPGRKLAARFVSSFHRGRLNTIEPALMGQMDHTQLRTTTDPSATATLSTAFLCDRSECEGNDYSGDATELIKLGFTGLAPNNTRRWVPNYIGEKIIIVKCCLQCRTHRTEVRVLLLLAGAWVVGWCVYFHAEQSEWFTRWGWSTPQPIPH
jgi:hypothetical protein